VDRRGDRSIGSNSEPLSDALEEPGRSVHKQENSLWHAHLVDERLKALITTQCCKMRVSPDFD
jgi:hypothetical protein